MTKEELVALGVTVEQADKIANNLKENFVAKAKFDEVLQSKTVLEKQVNERDKQLKELQTKVGDNEDLKQQIQDLQDKNKAAQKQYKAELHKMALDTAIDKALTSAHARNNKAVRALLDMDGVDLDDDGKLVGVSKQLKKLAEEEGTKFLFDSPEEAGKEITLSGMHPIHVDGKGGATSMGASFAAAYNSMINPTAGGGDNT